MNDSPFPVVMCALLLVFSGYTCHQGYQYGYEDHRAEVCQREHGVWMQRVGTDRHACVFGVRR
jgi:hypothetical protein